MRSARQRRHLVGVHRKAHRAARLAPFEAGIDEDAVEPLGLGLALDQSRARHDQRLPDRRAPGACRAALSAAARRSSIRLLVQLPMKMCSTATSCMRCAGRQAHIIERLAAPRRASPGSAKLSGSGTTPVIATTSSGLVPQVTVGAISLASSRTIGRTSRPRRSASVRHQLDSAVPVRALRRHRAALEIGESLSRRARTGRSAHRPRSTCWRRSAVPRCSSSRNVAAAIFDRRGRCRRLRRSAPTIARIDILGRHAEAEARRRRGFPASSTAPAAVSALREHARPRSCRCRRRARPSAPCAAVWLSPQTTVVPGRVNPCSGPTTWTMPCSAASTSMYGTSNSANVVARAPRAVSRLPDLRSAMVRRCRCRAGWSARCDRRQRASGRDGAPCGRRHAGLRMPAGGSPRGPDADRCR